MDRREALKTLGLMMGGTIVGAQAFISGCTTGRSGPVLSKSEMALLNEIGEVIIPKTAGSGGAKAADVASFMNTIVTDFYTDEDKDTFKQGIRQLNDSCRQQFGDQFTNLTKKQRQAVLLDLEDEAARSVSGSHYYIMIKQLTVWGWLSSEVAAKEAFRYDFVPGRFDPDIPFKQGEDKADFPHVGGDWARGLATFHMNRKSGDMNRADS